MVPGFGGPLPGDLPLPAVFVLGMDAIGVAVRVQVDDPDVFVGHVLEQFGALILGEVERRQQKVRRDQRREHPVGDVQLRRVPEVGEDADRLELVPLHASAQGEKLRLGEHGIAERQEAFAQPGSRRLVVVTLHERPNHWRAQQKGSAYCEISPELLAWMQENWNDE